MQIAVFTSRKNASDPFQSDAFFIIRKILNQTLTIASAAKNFAPKTVRRGL